MLPDWAEQGVALGAEKLKKTETNLVGHGQNQSFGIRSVVKWKCGNASSSEWVSHFVCLALPPGVIVEEVHCRYNELFIVDFAADLAWSRAWAKWREHYGITLPTQTRRRRTEPHAYQWVEPKKSVPSRPNPAGCAQPLGEWQYDSETEC